MNSQQATTAINKGRPHYLVLDGLRGVAAIMVVVFHFMERAYPKSEENFFSHGFLAVDFFFCLSGFVIAYAYDNRMQQIGAIEFFKSRLIRLHPLVIFGTVQGLIGYFFDPFGLNPALNHGWELLLIFCCSILMIPYPFMIGREDSFGINSPSWSLSFEYIANIAYALVLYRINRRWLWVLVVVSTVWLCAVSFHRGNLIGGWGGSNIGDGFARVFFSFLTGMLIYRSKWSIPNKLGFPVLALLLSLTFMVPYREWNWLVDIFFVVLVNPLLICLGIGTRLQPHMERICKFSGDISYPLYMTHYAFIWVYYDWLIAKKPDITELAVVITIGTVFLVFFAWLVLTYYDQPVRRWLQQRRMAKA